VRTGRFWSTALPLMDSLLDLVAAVGPRVADDELQLLAGVVHELPLEGPLLGPGGPGEPLVDVEQSVQTHRQGDEPPAHRLPHLHTHSFRNLPLVPERTGMMDRRTEHQGHHSPGLVENKDRNVVFIINVVCDYGSVGSRSVF